MALVSSANPVTATLLGRDHAVADSGNYFIGVNPTPGTGIASNAAPTALVETTPLFICYNGNTGTSINIYPIFLRFKDTAASTGGTGINFTHSLDNANRLSSGGTALTLNAVNPGAKTKSNATVTVGALTASGKTSSQIPLGNLMFRPTVIDQAGDQYEIQYGSPDGIGTGVDTAGTTILHLVKAVAPIVIPPGWSYLVNIWKASMSAAVSFEVEFGFVEK